MGNSWFVGILLATVACGETQAHKTPAAEPGSGLVQSSADATRKVEGGNAVCFGIVNGTRTDGYRAVVPVFQKGDANGSSTFKCTGTFIGSNLLLTAAHCVPENKDPRDVVYLPGESGSTVKKWDDFSRGGVHPRLVLRESIDLGKDGQLSPTDAYRDFALLVFSEDIAPEEISLEPNAVQNEAAAVMVGYGASDFLAKPGGPASDEKRVGENRIILNEKMSKALPHVYAVTGSLTDEDGAGSLASRGDSGGPLLVNGKLAGVASAAGKLDAAEKDFFGTPDGGVVLYGATTSPVLQRMLNEAKSQGGKFSAASVDGSSGSSAAGKDSGC